MRGMIWAGYIAWLKLRGPNAACRAVFHCHRKLRIRILRAFGAQIGPHTSVNGPVVIMNARKSLSNLRVGSEVHIGPDALLDLTAPIHIGDRATVSMRACVVTHLNIGNGELRALYPPKKGGVTIEEGAYLGANVTVLHGVTIGKGALVAAGAVVTKNVPPSVLVAGVPARRVKSLHESGAAGSSQ